MSHWRRSVPSTQHPAIMAGQVKLGMCQLGACLPSVIVTHSIDMPNKAVEVEQCVSTCRAASWTLSSSRSWPKTIRSRRICGNQISIPSRLR